MFGTKIDLNKNVTIDCPYNEQYRLIKPVICLKHREEKDPVCKSCTLKRLKIIMKNDYVKWDLEDYPVGEYVWDYDNRMWIPK